MHDLKIQPLEEDFSVCKVAEFDQSLMNLPFCFTARTDQELSLVCPTVYVPDNCIEREDGWKAFRVVGILDFSLIGILSKISTILAEHKIGIFAISTFNTDYILVKESNWEAAKEALKQYLYVDSHSI